MRTFPLITTQRDAAGLRCGRVCPPRRAGTVLILVLWISFALVALALYFANSMSLELRAADNQVSGAQAEQAIEGAAIYCSNILANRAIMTALPSPDKYVTHDLKIGDATVYLIGRDTNDTDASRAADTPTWGMIDEASKANLNSPTNIQITNLPNMTQQLLACIYDWRTTNTTPSTGGAKSETYSALNPPYECKLGNYETVDELRMVYGMSLDLLYGEDANMNGILDPNENDGPLLPPNDNADGKLDPGMLEYLTVYTHEPTNYGTTNRLLVSSVSAAWLNTNGLAGQSSQIMAALGGTAPSSVLDFYNRSKMSEAQFITIEPLLMNTNTFGLINVNTATATALACIPGIGYNNAASVLAYRQGNASRLNSIAWLKDALASYGTTAITQAGPWVTSLSFQFTADIAAVGHNGRGYHRVKFIFDCSSGVPQIIYRQDLTDLGWGLGKKLHDQMLTGKKM